MLKIAPSKNASVTLTNFYVATSRKILRLVYRIRITPATTSLLRAERRSNEWIARLVLLTTHQYTSRKPVPQWTWQFLETSPKRGTIDELQKTRRASRSRKKQHTLFLALISALSLAISSFNFCLKDKQMNGFSNF